LFVIKLNHSDTRTFALIIHILSSVKMLIWEWGCHLLARKPFFKCSALFISAWEKNKIIANSPFFPSFHLALPLLKVVIH